MFDETCPLCRPISADLVELPPRDCVFSNDSWQVVVHKSPVPGWLLVVLRRHVGTLSDLSPEEAASIGPVLVAGTSALMNVLGCPKTYVMLFVESAPHVHFHLVARPAELPTEFRAAGIFKYSPEQGTPSEADRDLLAVGLRAAWAEDAG